MSRNLINRDSDSTDAESPAKQTWADSATFSERGLDGRWEGL